VVAAFRNDLVPIMCIGEEKEIREAGTHVGHTLSQLDGGLAGIPAEQAERLVIAYEPVWAIGTGLTATPEDAQEMCGAIRGRLSELYSAEVADKVRIQYGGSVKGSNAAAIMAGPDVDGALIGGASLDAEDFVRIVRFREG
jgi:triosephosphate isomerase